MISAENGVGCERPGADRATQWALAAMRRFGIKL
jgi:hypothetical protein